MHCYMKHILFDCFSRALETYICFPLYLSYILPFATLVVYLATVINHSHKLWVLRVSMNHKTLLCLGAPEAIDIRSGNFYNNSNSQKQSKNNVWSCWLWCETVKMLWGKSCLLNHRLKWITPTILSTLGLILSTLWEALQWQVTLWGVSW